MSDQTDETTEVEEETQPQETGKRNWRRELEEQAARAKERAKELEKELAFAKIRDFDDSNPQHKFFRENYKGDFTKDAIAAKMTELGFLTESKSSVSQDTLDAQIRMDAASQNAEPATIQGADDQAISKLLDSDAPNLQAFMAQAKAAGAATSP